MIDKCVICGHFHKSDNDTKVCTLIDCMCDIQKFQPEIETKSIDYYTNVMQSFDNVADKVKYLLQEIPGFKDLTNKQFVFAYWHYNNGYTPPNVSIYSQLSDPETIRRCKQKVIENNPTLAASDEVTKKKNIKENAIVEWVTQ